MKFVHTSFPLAHDFSILEDDKKNRDVVRFTVSVNTSLGTFSSFGWRFFPDSSDPAKDTLYKPMFRAGQKSFSAVGCSEDFQTTIRSQARAWWDVRNEQIDVVAVIERMKGLYLQLGSWKAVQDELDRTLEKRGPENATQAAFVIAVRLLSLGLQIREQE